MSNQVVTIGYLRDFVKDKLTVSTSQSDSYCPTYSELTGNVLVPNYSSASNPKDTVNGIRINGCSVGGSYASNQLVVQADLQLLYMVLDKISIEADTTSVDACFDGSINICATGSFHLETKSEGGGISKGGTETDSTILVTWSGNADSSGPSNCTTISFDENKIGGDDSITTNPSSQPSRSESTSASYEYKGKNLTSNNYTTKTSNTVTIIQGANTLGSWYTNTSLDRNVTISVSCPGRVSEYGGSASVTSTVTYEYCEERKDQCGHIVGRKWTSKTITGPSQTVSFSEQECEEPARSETVSLTYTHVNGLTASDSCVVWQDASTESCYCGENCSDVGCSGRIHWLCTEKKVYENVDGSYTISGLKDDKLSCEGGTATVRITSSNDREYWTKSAYCSIETLGTVMGNSTSQDNVGLVYSHTGTTGTLYYTNSNLVNTSTYAAKYTAYTRNHITLHNNLDGTSSYITETIPDYSYKYEANSVNDWYQYSRKYYSRSSYVSAGGDGDDWDSAMDRYYDTYWEDGYYKCSITGEEVSSPSSKCETTDESGNTVTGTISWIVTDSGYDDDYDPRETGMTLWHTSYNVVTGQKPADIDMDKVAGACCVRNISTEHDYFWSAKTTPSSIIETFEYPQNKGIEDLKGSVVLNFKNTSPKPGQINSITVEYTVAACTTDTDKYTLVSVSGPTSMVACNAVPGNGVDIVVNGTHSIIKVSNIDPTISGETTPSAYTMVKDTDYKIEYTPTGSNTGDKERDITVTITGLGKFSGQTKTLTYKQKADISCFTGTTCEPSTSYTYSNYVITYNGGAVNCDKTATPTVKADKTTTITDVFCNESATTENSVTITDFTVSYSPNGNNNTTSNRVVTGTVTHNGETAGTFTYTQNSGQTCYATTDVTGTTSELSVINTTIEKCATSASITVKGRTGVTHTTGNTVWGNETTLIEGTHYTLSINPEIKANETDSPVIYTVTVNGIGTYANKSAQGTITQSAGPCTTCEPSTSYTYSNYVVTYNGGAVNCDKTATPTVKADKTTTVIDSYCKESTTTDNSVAITDFTVTYSPNGNNNTTSNRIVTGTVTHNGKTAGTFTYTQNSGETCYSSTDVTGFTCEISVNNVTIEACSTTASPTVQGRTGVTHTTGNTVWDDWTTLTNGTDYTLVFNPSLGENNTSSVKTYEVTATGKGTYANKTDKATVTQAAGPCNCTCKVTSISATPSAYTFTSEDDYEFTITIVDDGCSGCTKEFDVYEGNTWVKGGSGTISLPNKNATYTVKASDDTSKQCTIKTTMFSEEEVCYGLYVVCDRTQNRFKYDFTPLTQTDLTLKVTFYNSGSIIGTYTNTLIPQGMSGSDWLTLNFDVTYCDSFSVTQLTENSRGDDYSLLCDGQSTCVFEDSEIDCTCSVTSINVTPSEYTFTSNDSAYFDVLLIDNECSGCTSGWSIYKGSTFVKSGTSSSFSMSSDSDGEYTIKSNDDTSKVGKFTLTKYTTTPVCNVPSGSFAGDYDFRVNFSEAVTSDLTVYIDEKDGDCNVVNSFEVTVSKGKKTGYGYDVLEQNNTFVAAAYFEITDISPSSDSNYYYWGNGCEYDDSGNCTKAPDPITYSCKINYVNNTSETSKLAIVNLITTGLTAGQSKTLTLSGSEGSVTVTDTKAITWCIDSITNSNGSKTFSHSTNNGGSCFSLTINGNEITITISDSTPPPTPCSCSVTSISVNPSSYTFTSSTESKSFAVTIVDNECSGCTDQFLVYKSDGTHVTSGISIFSLSNQTGTFTIKAKDNQNKTCTLTTTEYTAPSCNSNYDYSNATLSFDASIGACDTTPNISNVKITNVAYTSTTCDESIIDETVPSSSYSITSTHSKNTGSTRNVTVSIETSSAYGSMTASKTITQEGGCYIPPSYTGSTTEYKLQVLNANMAKCDTTVSPTVQGASRTVSGYSDSSKKEGDWSSWSDLTKDTHYTLSYNPSLGENNTSSVKTYEVTATGKGTYAGKTAKGTITQAAGPCKCTESTTWNSISVTDVTAGKCSTSASMTVTASGTKTNTDCTTATTSTTLSSSNYTVKYGKTNGSYTLDSIEANETTSEVTWYYKVTASSTYGSKTATGSFKQEKGKCTPDPVYVMQKTSSDTSTNITFPGGTTYLPYPGYICCYSTKDGVKQSVTTSSDSTWLTVSENNESSYDGANYNFKFDQTENTSTTSRTGKITITQSGSNKKVVWTIVQAGKPNYVFKFNNPTGGFDSTSTETNIIHKPSYEGGGPTTTLTSTKDGSNVGYTMSSNVSWITTSTAATTCSWTISKNTSTSSRSGTITLTQSGSNKTLTISVTQSGAPTCNESITWNSINVSASNIGKCDTSASITVTASGTKTKTDCSTVSTSTTLTEITDFTKRITPTLDKNETLRSITYTVTVTGKGNYSGLTGSTTFTQDAGPCTDTHTNTISYTFPSKYGGYLRLDVIVNGTTLTSGHVHYACVGNESNPNYSMYVYTFDTNNGDSVSVTLNGVGYFTSCNDTSYDQLASQTYSGDWGGVYGQTTFNYTSSKNMLIGCSMAAQPGADFGGGGGGFIPIQPTGRT